MRTFIVILSWAALAAPGLADAPKNKADSKPLRFRMNPFHVNVGKIETVKPSGVVQVKDLANPRFVFKRNVADLCDVTEGYYLGVIADDFLLSTADAKVICVLVTEVGKQGSATSRGICRGGQDQSRRRHHPLPPAGSNDRADQSGARLRLRGRPFCVQRSRRIYPLERP